MNTIDLNRSDLKTLSRGLVLLTAHVTTSTGGDIDSADCDEGLAIEKTADNTGRYTVTIDVADGYVLRDVRATVLAAATPYTSDKGLHCHLLAWYPDSGEAVIQFTQPVIESTAVSESESTSVEEPEGTVTTTTTTTTTITNVTTYVDQEIEDGAAFLLSVIVKRRT